MLQEQQPEEGRIQTAPTALLNSGEHFDDVDHGHICALKRAATKDGAVLACKLLYDLVMVKGLVCPAPAAWRRD
jgi:hypothetical protein